MTTFGLDDLSVFVAVAETASFSKAAARLRLPKSSVSRAIARLERAFGVRLLHRTTRRVTLSSAGTALHEKVGPQIGALLRSASELPDLEEEPSGRLKVTTALGWDAVVAGVVARFTRRYPAVEVDISFSNQHVDLVAEGIDLALRFATKPLRDSSLTARRLGSDSLQLFASPSYVARQGAPRKPANLVEHEWVVFSHPPQLRLEGPGQSTTVIPHGRVRCDDLHFLREMLIEGCGIGALPPAMGEAEIATGRLVRVLPQWSAPVASLWALWPGPRTLPRKTAAFLQLVIEALGPLAASSARS